ncbi:hypothetical protein [Pseudoclavibacter sp. AY1H1]|uniref:hypothetical protein n=1 Tax=Pseudoclavibacter sp. AY1H1 TaxID=2080584 RepID=UPI000CE85C18|nr:hypothetical protein [Pseudoclavibacter sp. AY1H1]PPF39956.1 hypothetical protein C5E05_01720 [Pseudoclavibacter sp. AY1H1]
MTECQHCGRLLGHAQTCPVSVAKLEEAANVAGLKTVLETRTAIAVEAAMQQQEWLIGQRRALIAAGWSEQGAETAILLTIQNSANQRGAHHAS